MGTELLRIGDWEYRTERDRLIMPASHAGDAAIRVRYRPIGGRVFRSFLMLGTGGETPEPDAIAAAIEGHAADAR